MNDPRQKDFDERHTKLPTVTALTKREYFAVMAMQGLLSQEANERSIDQLASVAITSADELLKRLEQK